MTISKIVASCLLVVEGEHQSLVTSAHEDGTFTCTIDGKQQMYPNIPAILQAWNESETRKFVLEHTDAATGRHPLGREASSQRRSQREGLQD